jgi:hypothetical protein
MGDLWVLLFSSLSLAAFHGVRGCLECDPKFTEDVRTLLGNLVPLEVPDRNQLLDRQHKEITHISSKVSHKDKMLRLLGEGSLSPESLGDERGKGGMVENQWIQSMSFKDMIIAYPTHTFLFPM